MRLFRIRSLVERFHPRSPNSEAIGWSPPSGIGARRGARAVERGARNDANATHPLAGDPHHHLVEVPAIAWLRTAPAQPSRDHRSEFQHPTPDGFVRDVEPALGEQFPDVAIAQREAQIEPDRMLDDHRGKAVAAIGDFGHRASLPSASLPSYPVTLTKPERRR